MDSILAAQRTLENKSNLSKALNDVQSLITTLQATRDNIAANPDMAALHVAKLRQPIKASFDRIEDDLKDVNRGLNQYQKALKDRFKGSALPTAGAGESGGLQSQSGLVNRAIAMHLLREGKFGVASTFVKEVSDSQRQQQQHVSRERADTREEDEMDGLVVGGGELDQALDDQQAWIRDFQIDSAVDDAMSSAADSRDRDVPDTHELGKGQLQKKFADMYRILDALRNQHNLGPAIEWAHQNSTELEARGSNLEFELSRLKFVELYTSSSTSGDDLAGPLAALEYGRTTFSNFSPRYERDIKALVGSLAFSSDLSDSPYEALFNAPSAYTSVCDSFTREFCSLLSLPPQSPLYTAVTAGGIALPILEKVERVMAQTRGQWTSVNELPVETPLPPGYLFHSIFVCPVSKEQATDLNPPMMLPCGHVIAKESLEMHSRGKSRIKCPYCPQECHPKEAKRVYI